jgi:hypothetical protein
VFVICFDVSLIYFGHRNPARDTKCRHGGHREPIGKILLDLSAWKGACTPECDEGPRGGPLGLEVELPLFVVSKG